jgi:hypothetical protein
MGSADLEETRSAAKMIMRVLQPGSKPRARLAGVEALALRKEQSVPASFSRFAVRHQWQLNGATKG